MEPVLATWELLEQRLQQLGRVNAQDAGLDELPGLCRALATQAQLRAAEFEAVLEATTVAIAHIDRDFVFVRVNQAYADADGRTPEFYVGKQHFELFPNAENQRIFEDVRATGRPYSARARPFEFAHNPERGVSHWDWTVAPVLGATNEVEGLVLVLHDVSDRIEALEAAHQNERLVAEQLAEKELLLREIHHRVKNNLQVVSSLLYLQSTHVDEPSMARSFADCRTRIQAMSLIHEVLYQSDTLERVDFAAYLRALVGALRQSYVPEDIDIRLSVDVEVGDIDIGIAVPCGLIASELITNALKHAFDGRTRGNVRISLVSICEGRWMLDVHDDGIGLPKPLMDNLGLRLVRTLGAQLDGELCYESNREGTCFCLCFPAPGLLRAEKHACNRSLAFPRRRKAESDYQSRRL